MWLRLNLRLRIYLILSALVVITLSGGLLMVWYTYQMEGLLTTITDKHLVSYQSAQALESALVNQKGFVSYYFLDGDADWLRQLGTFRQIFAERLSEAVKLAAEGPGKNALVEIEAQYHKYVAAKDQVIELYKTGNRSTGAALHESVRDRFFDILDLCEQYKRIQTEKIIAAKQNSHHQAMDFRIISWMAMFTGIFLAAFLAFVLANQILGPIRELTEETRRRVTNTATGNEIKALRLSVHGLMEDADQTYTELMKSREHLVQAEKLALVGKLAAGMAHSIRNPFTSVKMRLFSLGRSLDLTEYQKEDFDVITKEIKHIDTILQNFLEFSRPPKLIMQSFSPSNVVDQSIQLLEHRLKSYDVTVKVVRQDPLPRINIDPEQIKEVLVNLIINACEAIRHHGRILISEEIEKNSRGREFATIRISDNGQGISQTDIDKVFEPFFTTKEEGTGLGLSIASRIIDEHGGILEVTSAKDGGTTFTITFPI